MQAIILSCTSAGGTAKGSVDLSFTTMGEIFITLLEDGFGQLLGKLHSMIALLPRAHNEAAQYFANAL